MNYAGAKYFVAPHIDKTRLEVNQKAVRPLGRFDARASSRAIRVIDS
jgi:hypothetical protein